MPEAVTAPPSRWHRLGAHVRLVRPLNVALMLIGALIGGVLVAGGAALGSGALWTATLAAALIGGAANAINDLYDLAIDRVNRPDRPLPSGLVTPRVAWITWGVLSAVALVLAATVSVVHLGIAAASVALLFAYSARLKRVPLAGTLAVTAVLALALPFGGLAVWSGEALGPLLFGATFAAGTTFARELVKDIEDVAGDAADGAETLALRLGTRPTARLAAAMTLLLVLGIPAGAFVGLPSLFLIAVLPAAALLLAAAWTALGLRNDAEAEAGRASTRLKGAMLAGLIALAISMW